jgi:hypothetical protein
MMPCRTATSKPTEHRKYLSDVNKNLFGDFLKVVNPSVWARVTRRWQFTGTPDRGQALRTTCVWDACNMVLAPQLTMIRDFTRNTRALAQLDVLITPVRPQLAIGQRLRLFECQNQWGFKQLKVAPELQLGVDLHAMEPTIKVVMDDDDFKGVVVSPMTHPAVLLGGAGLYASMLKWQFPFSYSVPLYTYVTKQGHRSELQLFTRTQRQGDKKLTTTNLSGVMLTLRV